MRILIVEDDAVLGDGLLTALTLEGNAVDWVNNKESALLAFNTHNYDMIVMDIGLPDGSGLDVLAQIRNEKNHVPVLMLTAYDTINYKVQGLDTGADDYLIKPFELEELKARIRSLNRRRKGRSHPILKGAGVELNPANKNVTLKGQLIKLGPKEFIILQLLMENPDAVISKETLEEQVYGWENEIESNTIEVHVSKLRKKLGPNIIETMKHVGYRFATTS